MQTADLSSQGSNHQRSPENFSRCIYGIKLKVLHSLVLELSCSQSWVSTPPRLTKGAGISVGDTPIHCLFLQFMATVMLLAQDIGFELRNSSCDNTLSSQELWSSKMGKSEFGYLFNIK